MPLALILAFSTIVAQASQDPSREEQRSQVVAEFDAARARCIEASRLAKTEAEENAIHWPRPKEFAPRLVKLLEANPADETARKASVWLLEHHLDFGEANDGSSAGSLAAQILVRNHVNDESVGLLSLNMDSYPSPSRDVFLRGLWDRSENRTNRGRACLALARYLKMKSEHGEQIQLPSNSDALPEWTKHLGNASYTNGLKSMDTRAMKREAEELYRRVVADFSELKFLPNLRHPDKTRTLGVVAASDLDDLLHLSVGKPAPEISGDDVEGRPMKLSEYRGKVVVLVFWGVWCPSCMAQVPHESELAGRYLNRPFALLGVNSDDDREKLKSAIEREKIAGRSWFDGGKSGPIATAWKVPWWPTLYVLDHKGIIRGKGIFDKDLDRLVEALVREAERPAGR